MRTSEQQYRDFQLKIRRRFNIRSRDIPPHLCRGTRDDLGKFFNEMGYKTGAEIGVFHGYYSLSLCQSIPGLKLYCVDPWAEWHPIRHGAIWKMEAAFQEVKEKLKPYDVEYLRMTSIEASKLIKENALDFIYIDALHDFRNVMLDLLLWEPKVRIGGIVAGHDYFNSYGVGVVQAVDSYVKSMNIPSLYITLPDQYNNAPSWFWGK